LRIVNRLLEARSDRINDDSRKGAKDKAKPASSKQLAVGSNSDYGLQDSKQQEINLSAWIF